MGGGLRARVLRRCGDAAAQAAGLFALSAVLALVAVPTSPGRAALLIVLAVANLVTASVVLALPWASWETRRTAVLAWPAFAFMGLSTWAFGGFTAGTGPFFVLFFAWLGLHHQPRVIAWYTPLAAAAYVAPLVASGADARLLSTTAILLPTAVGIGLLISAQVRALTKAQEQLAFQATRDPLTGLPNRAQVMDLLHGALHRTRRTGDLLAVMFIDLDGFKAVNDTHGHRAGDTVLRSVAELLRAEIRAGDTAARLGGDEFVVVLETVDSEASGVAAARRILRAIAHPIPVSDSDVARVGASVGITFNLDSSTDAGAVLRQADVAAHQAKDAGRGRVVTYGNAAAGGVAEPTSSGQQTGRRPRLE